MKSAEKARPAQDGVLMTKQEVADYLRVSLRMVAGLRIVRSYVGRLPRYDKRDVDAFVLSTRRAPADVRRAPRGALHVPLPTAGDVETRIARLKGRLQRDAVKKGD